jgi:tetratricopeptide (TPR) repeat protein
MPKPLCFVLMPFGKKPDSAGKLIDFDAVYKQLIAPAIKTAGLEPLRADEEKSGGIIHKPMYERLILCDFAVADLTTANANVFYELGIRHAARPWSTVMLFAAGGSRLPFDVAPLRALPYQLSTAGGPADVVAGRAALTALLKEARKETVDSPIYRMVEDYPDVDHTKTDVFREQVDYSADIKQKLAQAREKESAKAMVAIERQMGDLCSVESGAIVDLLLSYRAVSAWKEMVALVKRMSKSLARSALVQEQYGLALNRAGRSAEAEQVLLDLIKRRGPSSETYGILGRVYKDRWQAAKKKGNVALARGALKKAADTYLRGFEADWRDAYPGVNAVTLMELQDPPDPRGTQLIPVVRYAVERRIAGGRPDYWDYATLLELAALANDGGRAMDALGDAFTCRPERWMRITTADNLAMILEARARRKETQPWLKDIERQLRPQAKKKRKH